jgi:hypothetical protein
MTSLLELGKKKKFVWEPKLRFYLKSFKELDKMDKTPKYSAACANSRQLKNKLRFFIGSPKRKW